MNNIEKIIRSKLVITNELGVSLATKEIQQLVKQAYEEGCRVASPFGNQGLSKSEKENWEIWSKNKGLNDLV